MQRKAFIMSKPAETQQNRLLCSFNGSFSLQNSTEVEQNNLKLYDAPETHTPLSRCVMECVQLEGCQAVLCPYKSTSTGPERELRLHRELFLPPLLPRVLLFDLFTG